MSLAVTAAHRRGLYPHLWLWTDGDHGRCRIRRARLRPGRAPGGPTILGLRVVSLAASIAGLACIWMLTRTLYGSGTAWMAAAIASSLRLFVMSNSVRMDSMAFAYVAGSLLVFSLAWQRWEDGRRHLLAGLVFGLGLQVHIDTTVSALACGALYVVVWLRDMWRAKHARWQPQMFWYICGWASASRCSSASTSCPILNRSTGQLFSSGSMRRVGYSHGTSSIAGSFLDPRILLAKKPLVTACSFARCRYRSASGRRCHRALLVARIVDRLNDRDCRRAHRCVDCAQQRIASLFHPCCAAADHADGAPLDARLDATFARIDARADDGVAAVVRHRCFGAVRREQRQECVGCCTAPEDTAAAALPRASDQLPIDAAGSLATVPVRQALRRLSVSFISSRPTEVHYAMLYYGLTDEAAYWDIKKPDVVFTRADLSEGLSRYVTRRGLSLVDQGIWSAPGGCTPE